MHTKNRISYTQRFTMHGDDPWAIADLGLSPALEQRMLAADDRDPAIGAEISRRVTEQLRTHGVNIETYEWLGDWSAEDIVRDVLDGPAKRQQLALIVATATSLAIAIAALSLLAAN